MGDHAWIIVIYIYYISYIIMYYGVWICMELYGYGWICMDILTEVYSGIFRDKRDE
jgi:hypothetical protein